MEIAMDGTVHGWGGLGLAGAGSMEMGWTGWTGLGWLDLISASSPAPPIRPAPGYIMSDIPSGRAYQTARQPHRYALHQGI